MGILNVTPDSFSDGGKYLSVDNATAHARQLISDGADILDVGAESTRPNSLPISVNEEISRLEKILPAIKNLDVPVSIDTYKPEVAEFALENGADIVNDVYGLEDSRMTEVVKKFNVPVIVGHSGKCCDDNIIDDVKKFFRMTEIKLNPAQIIFDVGIGFGKTQEENLEILRRLDELKVLDGEEIPLMIGASRKSFIGWATGFPIEERDEATGAICVHAISKGVNIVRVHNVKMIVRMCRMADKLLKEK
ncbi:MAG: dihydropteroate synthase [Selenomonadaceae bacterium]|nr:dihydropteroate synthase [Selenomonadaceae bacterium]